METPVSLEVQITELTAAINKLTTITQALHDLRVDAIEKTSAAAASTKSTKGADKAADKAADKPKEETKQAIQENPENRVDPTEELTTLAADYIGASDREEERAARKEKVKALLNHDKIRGEGVKAGDGKLNNVGNVDLFKDQIAKLKAKGDITEPPKASGDDLDL